MKPSPQEKIERNALAPWVDRWKGKTVVCIGSGPSLTPEDIELVRGLPTLVTNTTFRAVPWADVLVGFDVKWWRKYADEVQRDFLGEKVTCAKGARKLVPQMHCFGEVPWLVSFANSGAVTVVLATIGGAGRILMVGFDCQKTDGKVHHHGDHPPGLGNGASIKNWPKCFKNASRFAAGKTLVLNCSRVTALTCFPRVPLEEALA